MKEDKTYHFRDKEKLLENILKGRRSQFIRDAIKTRLTIDDLAYIEQQETIITLQTKNPQTILQKKEYKKHIQTAHNTTGEYNTMLITIFKNPEELNTFLKALNNEKIVEKMNTQLILETINT